VLNALKAVLFNKNKELKLFLEVKRGR